MGRTRKVTPTVWRDYHRKSRLLLEAGVVCLEYELFDAAAMLAIHSAILAADAVLVRNAAVRSASGNHDDAVRLLADNVRDSGPAQRQLSALLAAKNFVEYTGQRIEANQARDLVKRAQRLAAWCLAYLPEI